ncbi:MAG: hypothetical protein IJ272_08650 [Clostridia bacterium]|nr:hypothetical protein [Clostridia bacterium]
MKVFKFKKNKKREKKINWMTVKCDTCTYLSKPYVMYVDRDEIGLRPSGYKGRVQAYTTCTKCGKGLVIKNEHIPKTIWKYLLKKWLAS